MVVLRHGNRDLHQIQTGIDPEHLATGEKGLQLQPADLCGFAKQLGIEGACVFSHEWLCVENTRSERTGAMITTAPVRASATRFTSSNSAAQAMCGWFMRLLSAAARQPAARAAFHAARQRSTLCRYSCRNTQQKAR